MNTSKIWKLGAVVAIVAILAGAVGLGVQPQLASAAAADTSTAEVNAQRTATQLELARLSRLAATQTALEATNSKLGSAITGSLRLSTFSQQLRDVAALDGVTLVSMSPSTATAYAPIGAASTSATSTSATSTSATSTSSTSTGSTSTGTPSTGTTAAAAPAAVPGQFGKTAQSITAANFTLIPVTVIVTGTEAAAVQFASDVQHMNRLFAVSNVAYAVGTDGTPPTTTISGDIYALKQN